MPPTAQQTLPLGWCFWPAGLLLPPPSSLLLLPALREVPQGNPLPKLLRGTAARGGESDLSESIAPNCSRFSQLTPRAGRTLRWVSKCISGALQNPLDGLQTRYLRPDANPRAEIMA